MDRKLLDEARAFAKGSYEDALGLLRELARIPSPTGHEERRAAFVAGWLASAGAHDVRTDDAGNVLCLLGPHGSAEPLTVLSAHTDIVFDDNDELPLSEDEARIWAPGVGDDTANLVVMLMCARWMAAREDELARPMLLVANTGEEGLGNLAGTKALYARLGERIGRHVTFDLYLPQVITSAVGSRRYRISVEGPGGHSWADHGAPSAVDELCRIVSELADTKANPLPSEELTTQNTGVIGGGITVNSIAAHAEALYEARSTSERCLAEMEERLEGILARHRVPGMAVTCESIGVRPGNGDVDRDALEDLGETCADAVASVTGLEPDRSPASTDANIPLSLGIPAACVGCVRGAALHTRDEWIEKESIADGLAVAYSLVRMLGC